MRWTDCGMVDRVPVNQSIKHFYLETVKSYRVYDACVK